MPLILVGLNHRTAPVELRERLSTPEAPGETSRTLRGLAGVEGAAIISTCNRVEVVVSASDEDVIAALVDWLSVRGATIRAELEKHLYVLRHADVVKHIFRVAAGLDSMVLGEPQIGGQVRQAFAEAQQAGTLDSLLVQLFENTMRVAKKVRSETAIGENAVSVPYAAVELSKKIFGDLEGLQVLLVGAGEMGELTAEHLHAQKVRQVRVVNRSYERAAELAARFGGDAVPFENLAREISECDIVITSTGAAHFVIEVAHVKAAMEARRRRNLFLIDLSVPRNVDPAIAQVEGAYLYNVDDLQSVADRNMEQRQLRAADAEGIVTREAEAFRRRLVAQDAVPTILDLQQRLEAIRAAELEKCLRKMGPLSAEQHQAVEMFSTGLVNKILHYPILQLKETSDEPERDALRRTIRRIFGLR